MPLLSFFRTNQLSFGIFLLPIAVLLHYAGSFVVGAAAAPPPDPAAGPLGSVFTAWVGNYPLAASFVPPFLFGVQALLINAVIFRERLARRQNLFPGLLLVIGGCLLPAFLPLHSLQLANLFLLLSISPLLRIYRDIRYATDLFQAGWWLGLAVLCNTSLLPLLPVYLVGIGSLRAISVRMWLMQLTGTLAAVFLAAAAFFLLGAWSLFVDGLPEFSYRFSFRPLVGLEWIGLLVPAALIVYAIFSSGPNYLNQNIEHRKKIQVIYYFLLGTVLSLLLVDPITVAHWQITLVPLAMLLSLSLTRAAETTARIVSILIVGLLLFIYLLPFLQAGGFR
ncbi:MAG: hypothetical protein WBA17_18140 [Saprospiraceae bacterium]